MSFLEENNILFHLKSKSTCVTIWKFLYACISILYEIEYYLNLIFLFSVTESFNVLVVYVLESSYNCNTDNFLGGYFIPVITWDSIAILIHLLKMGL